MQKIHFDYLPSPLNFLLVIPAIILISIHLVALFSEAWPLLKTASAVAGYALIVVYLGKMFVFRNYAGWNDRGMYLKIGFFKGHNISFNSIKSIEMQEQRLEIRNLLKDNIELDLSAIRKKDAEKLVHILLENAPRLRS